MTFLFHLLLCGLSIQGTSDGTGFFPVPDSVWVAPAGAYAVFEGDTLPAVNSARGGQVGLQVDPAPPPGVAVTLWFDTLAISSSNSPALRLVPLDRVPVGLRPSYSLSPAGEGLYISGVKRLGVSLGSDGGLVQGTRISLDGTLAQGVTVRGSITDESLPLGSASSEAVSQLDRVNLQVQGGTWSTELGDIDREASGGPLSPMRWRRSMSGFAGTGSPVGAVTGGAGYGVTGARRYNTVFLTQEGVQGPYTFAPSGVTPGSERVYLDGALLQRGSGADYTVDYPGGRLTFSSSRLIRRDQRVEVSCYREGDGFRRGILTADARAEGEGFAVDTEFFREGDDTGAPLGFVMSPEAEEALRNAGENPEDAWIDGATFLGEGKGSYSLDSLGNFVYRGPGGGEWSVVFQRPPKEKGDYIYDSILGGFRWVGVGEGSHLPRKYIDIPTGREVGGVTLFGERGFFSGRLSGYVSRREGNLLNPMETTREGSFLSTGLSFSPWETGPSLVAKGRFVSDGFTFPDESDSDRELARWLLPPGFRGGDSWGEAGLESENLAVIGGRRFFPEGGSVERVEGFLALYPGSFSLRFDADAGRRNNAASLADGNRLSLGTGVEYGFSRFTPFVSGAFSREAWTDSLDGWIHDGELGSMAFLGPWNLRAYVGGILDRRGGPGMPERVARAGVTGAGRGASWSFSGSANHSASWFEGGGLSRADAIALGLFLTGGGWWANTDYSAGGYIARSVEVIYTWVGQGNGDYGYDPETGEYYPDPGGEYARSFQSGDGEERVLECRLKSSGTFRGDGAGIEGNVSLAAENPSKRLETFLLAGAFDTSGPGEWSAALSPWLHWDEGVLRRLSLRVSASDGRETLSGAGLRRSIERSARITPLLRPGNVFELELSARVSLKQQDFYGPRRITGLLVSADPRYIPTPGVQAGLLLSAENRRERFTPLDETMYTVKPHVSVNTGGWTTHGSWSVGLIPGEGALPPWFFDGSGRGVTLDGSLNAGRNLGRWFRLSLFFRGRRPAGGSWTRTGGLEGTVSF